MPPLGLIPQAKASGIGALGTIYFSKNDIPKKLLKDKRIEYLAIWILTFFLFTNLNLKYIACPVISLFLILKIAHNAFPLYGSINFLTINILLHGFNFLRHISFPFAFRTLSNRIPLRSIFMEQNRMGLFRYIKQFRV